MKKLLLLIIYVFATYFASAQIITEKDFINVIALAGNAPIEENFKIVDAFLEAKEDYNDPSYKMRVEQILEYEND